ncbi:MAG TPA: hypothetical protein VGC34_01500 [Steroidobacteraceae bacterium]
MNTPSDTATPVGHWQPPKHRPVVVATVVVVALIALSIILDAWSLPPFSAGS